MSARRTALLLLVLATVACRHAEKRPTRTEPWLASASASSSSGPALRRAHYKLARTQVELELPARHADPKGKLEHARGELDVDLDDLSHTTGNLVLDLTDLALLGADGASDATYTARARAWLELGTGVAAEKRDAARSASFAISGLDAGHLVSAPNGDRRVARRELLSNWAVRGELSLHGVRAPLTADVSLTLVPGPDPAAPPVQFVIRSRRPLVINLGTHDIRPRDERGVPIAKDQALLGDKVGSEAKVSFDLVFVPG